MPEMQNLNLLDVRALAHAEDGTIVPRAARASLAEVDQVLARANEMLAQVQHDARTIRADAYLQGYREGCDNASEAMTTELIELQRRCHALYEEQQALVREMAIVIVERLAPQLDAAQLVSTMVARALLEAQAEQYVLIRVHPRHVETARAAIGELGNLHPAVARYEVVADENIEELGCAIESEAGVVRSSWSRQIAAIRAALAAPREDHAG